MKNKISISRLLMTWMLGFTFAFLLIIGFILQINIREIREEYRRNLQFRSSLFKESIESSIIMGDYSSVVAKANSFFNQADVASINITLRDGSTLVDLAKTESNLTDPDYHKTIGSIFIIDKATNSNFSISSFKVYFELSSLKRTLSSFVFQWIVASLLFLAVTISSVLYFSRKFNNPLRKLSQAALSGDLQVIYGIKKDAKIAELFSLESAFQSMGAQLIELSQKEKENFKNAAVGRIIAHLSHDLRAPLGVIERFLSIPDNEMPEMKATVRESLSRLYSMVESLRYSEVETIITKSPVPFSFRFILETIQGKAEQLNIKVYAPHKVVGLLIIDLMKIERALLNLVSNAIDFAKSEVWIEYEIQSTNLNFKVIDDGPGVYDEFLPKLFNRGSTYGKVDGTGLGLAYVRQIMRGHGGDVTYRREDSLTVFECLVPNAVELEKEQPMEDTTSFDIQLVQKLERIVAICLEPESLSKSVLLRLTSYKSNEFSFSEEREEANLVVSNIDGIMFQVLEADEQEFIHVSSAWGNEDNIIDRLKLKFNLS